MKGITSVAVNHLNAGGTEISLLLGGEFLGLGVQGEGTGAAGFIGVSGKTPVILHNQAAHIVIRNGRAVIKVQQIIQIADFHLVGRILGVKSNSFCLLVENDGHMTLLLCLEGIRFFLTP